MSSPSIDDGLGTRSAIANAILCSYSKEGQEKLIKKRRRRAKAAKAPESGRPSLLSSSHRISAWAMWRTKTNNDGAGQRSERNDCT
jgi:hypothetical protein